MASISNNRTHASIKIVSVNSTVLQQEVLTLNIVEVSESLKKIELTHAYAFKWLLLWQNLRGKNEAF